MARVITGASQTINVNANVGDVLTFGTGDFITFLTSTVWIVPAGITNIAIHCYGAGGGGGSRGNGGGFWSGSGGGSGSYSFGKRVVTPGDQIPIVVGAAGTRPSIYGADGSAGGTSSCLGITAGGGGGGGAGKSGASNPGGAGGLANGGLKNFHGNSGETSTGIDASAAGGLGAETGYGTTMAGGRGSPQGYSGGSDGNPGMVIIEY